MNENKSESCNATVIDEMELKHVAGGDGGSKKGCYFTPTGEKKEENGKVYMKCSVFCGSQRPGNCDCHGYTHCVDKWHEVQPPDMRLHPIDFTNHTKKQVNKNYNT